MKFRWDNRYLHWGVTAFFVIAASMLFYYGIFHMRTLITGIKTFFSIMAPIIYGIVIAYILSSVVNFLEQKIIFPILKRREVKLQKRGKRLVRWISVLSSLAFLILIIYALIMMILPQLIRNVMNIIYSFPAYMRVVENWINTFAEKGFSMDTEMLDMLTQFSNKAQEYLTNTFLPQMQEMLKSITTGLFDVFIFLKNFIIGAIISIYVLADKEVFVGKSKMIVYALFSTKHANNIIHAMRFTHCTFGGFISGKILDSAIIGVLCYIGTTLLDIPYALLVSVIVGVTNVIPFFGPFIGAIPTVLLILLVDPIKALYLAIFILILQQFDGNVLGPKILGDSTGLSSFMVIVAIMIGSGLFGVPGMIVGVPLCAVIYAATWHLLGKSLIGKKMPLETEEYCNIDCINPVTKEAIPMPKEPEHYLHEQHIPKNPDNLFLKIWNLLVQVLIFILTNLKKLLLPVFEKIKTVYNKIRRKAHGVPPKAQTYIAKLSKICTDKYQKLKEANERAEQSVSEKRAKLKDKEDAAQANTQTAQMKAQEQTDEGKES